MVLTHVSWLYQMTLLKCLKHYYLIQSTGSHFICCHVDRYMHEHNLGKFRAIKFPDLTEFRVPTKFTKLKLIEHFAHATLNIPDLQ